MRFDLALERFARLFAFALLLLVAATRAMAGARQAAAAP